MFLPFITTCRLQHYKYCSPYEMFLLPTTYLPTNYNSTVAIAALLIFLV